MVAALRLLAVLHEHAGSAVLVDDDRAVPFGGSVEPEMHR
jgi:hypothetical protein